MKIPSLTGRTKFDRLPDTGRGPLVIWAYVIGGTVFIVAKVLEFIHSGQVTLDKTTVSGLIMIALCELGAYHRRLRRKQNLLIDGT